MPDLIINESESSYEQTIRSGLRLANTPMSRGGWAEYFDPRLGLDIKNEHVKATTAILLENNKRWQAQTCSTRRDPKTGLRVLNEAVRSATLGGFVDYLFPIIRAATPMDVTNDLFSVQPTTRPIATVTHWDYIYGTTKGTTAKGTTLFGANTGLPFSAGGAQFDFNYSGELVQSEPLVTLGSANATITGALDFIGSGIRPGTVKLSATATTAGAITLNDNGAGAFVQSSGTSVTISASSINYATGAISVTLSGDTFTTATVAADYEYDSEGSSDIPELDIRITTTTAEVRRRALKLIHSIEAQQRVAAEYGESVENNLLVTASELLNYERYRQVMRQVWAVSDVISTFTTAFSGISQEQHFRSIIYTLNVAASAIERRTQKGTANWIVADEGACNVIGSLPRDLFQPAPAPASYVGPYFFGTLAGRFRVYKDIHLRNEPGASATGNMLLGWKGRGFQDAGLVIAPFNALYTTEPVVTADFLSQRGVATSYALKLVNKNFYTRINLTAS